MRRGNTTTVHVYPGVASRIGESHINFPIGYQDAYFCMHEEGLFVGIICDGCSLSTNGYTQNQLGAILGAEIIARNLFKSAKIRRNPNPSFKSIVRRTNRDTEAFFKRMLRILRSSRIRIDRKKYIEEKLLFTVLGLFIMENWYCFFGCGDGLFAINGLVTDIEKESPGQKYLQPLLNDSKNAERFTIYKTGAVQPDDTLWIASDGLVELLRTKHGHESFDHFLRDERVCRIIDDSDQTIQPFRQLAQKHRNHFNDDVTLIIAKVRQLDHHATEAHSRANEFRTANP
jgi:hypothetical protein